MIRRIERIVIPILVYVLFIIELIVLFTHPLKCPFSNTVRKISSDIDTYDMTEKEYIFEVEENSIDQDDIFQLGEISGWIVKKEDNKYISVPVELILSSKDAVYQVETFPLKRMDVYYLDQSNENSKNLYAGYMARFPADSMEAGNYRIGFQMNKGFQKKVLWTDETLLIPEQIISN